jgi:hypothetical protein
MQRELLRVVLANTLKKNGVPPQWIGAEINVMSLPSGEPLVEIRFSVQCDEPRLLTYLSSFQADFLRRLLAIAPDADKWLSGIVWALQNDAIYEIPMPSADYWEDVQADRELTARQKGALDWDRETIARHFSDTNPSELMVNFGDTQPPDRDIENISRPKA